MVTWAWLLGNTPVRYVVSEGRAFSKHDRVLILATSFYESPAPEEQKPKIKLQDQHQFTLKGQDWFWIAGIVKNDCFTMLTVAPGPDIAPYHDRQIAVLAPDKGMVWLSEPEKDTLRPLPKGRLQHRLLRKNGIMLP